ncbi:MAG: ABC transporter substrate-binding protein [Desulfurivibrionaceae bacterium]
MKKCLPLIALLLLAFAPTAWALDCVLLQSSPLKPYEEARLGFERSWLVQHPASGPKSISGNTVTQVLLSEQQATDTFSLKKQLQDARLVVAIGDQALDFVKELREVPVVYLLAPSAAASLPRNFVGIEMRIQPSRQLAAINKALPRVHAIGVLYNPAQSGHWVQEALLSPVASIQTLLFKKFDNQTSVPGALQELAGKIDAYWLLPDPQLTAPQVLGSLLEFSMKNRVPIISFSEKYLAQGAAMAVTFDTTDLGAQAAELGAHILRDGLGNDTPALTPPRKIRVEANLTVLERLGVFYIPKAIDAIYPPETGR